MMNWNVDETQLKKDPKKHELWRISQLINYGMGGEKLKKDYLLKNWAELSLRIDPNKKSTLEFMMSH